MENAKLLPGFLDGCDTFEEYLEKVARHIFFAGNGCGDYYLSLIHIFRGLLSRMRL